MNRKFQIKWHHLYYMLAAFDVLAISGSLYLNHQIMSNYNLAVELNQAWANRLKLLSNLADLAIEVNAPGNNVFDDGNAALHRSLRDDAHRRYLKKVSLIEQNVSEIADTEIRADFLGRLDTINAAMDDMLEEADSIFSLFDARKGVDAGSRMATMDRKAAQLLTQISSFAHHIQDIQKTNFDEQLRHASSLRRYEYLIAGIIVVMVLLVTIYGHKLAVQIRRTHEERERNHSILERQARQVEESERRLSTILDSVSDGIIIVNAQGTIEDLNPAAELLFEYIPRQVLGKNISTLIPEITDVPGIYDCTEEITVDQTFIKMEFVARRKSGEQFHVDFSFNEFNYEGETKYTCIVRDITRYKKYREKIKRLAMKDSLTGLFNRNSFNTYFRRTLERDQANANLTALMLIDIDRFKFINDTYGHHVGDALLIQATERMRTVFRGNDLIARLGGDEFAIVLGDIADAERVSTLSSRLISVFREPFYIELTRIDTSISVGISLSPNDDSDPEALLRKSDLALYSVKESGRGNFSFYNSKMQNRAFAEKLLEQQLHRALANNEFELFYQPQFDIDRVEIHGVEALIRWNHPERGIIPPKEFISVAEKTALIIDIGSWALVQCCKQWRIWRDNGVPVPKISINVSARQLNHQDFLGQVHAILDETGVSGENLEFELTETAALSDIDDCIAKINAIRKLGISFAVDDFGSGNSSLTYLSQMPMDCVKVDRSFIENIHTDPTQAVITESLIKLAKRLDIVVIAEGVENAFTANVLGKMGCHIMQGYYYSRPLSVDEISTGFSQEDSKSKSG